MIRIYTYILFTAVNKVKWASRKRKKKRVASKHISVDGAMEYEIKDQVHLFKKLRKKNGLKFNKYFIL